MKPICRSGCSFGTLLVMVVLTSLSRAVAAPGAAPEAALPPGAIARLGEPRFRFDRPYLDFLLTPDDKLLAALTEGKVHVGELASGKEVAAWPNLPKHYRFAGVTADSKELATFGHTKAEVVFYELAGQRKEKAVTFPLEPFRHVKTVVPAPDGRRLAFIVEVQEKNRLWHRLVVVDRNERKALFQVEHTQIYSAGFSADGKTVAMSIAQYEPGPKQRIVAIKVCDIATGKVLQELGRAAEAQHNTYRLLAFSADGKRLAAVTRVGEALSFWDLAAGKEIAPDAKRDVRELAADFPPPVRFVAWTRAAQKQGDDFKIETDGKHYQPIAITADQRTLVLTSVIGGLPFSLRLMDIASRKELPPSAVPAGYAELHFLAEGNTLLARQADGVWQLWDVKAKKVVPAFDGKDAEAVARTLHRAQPVWFDAPHFGSGLPAPAALEKGGFKKINFDRWEKVEEAGRSPDGKVLVQRKTAWWNFSGAVPKTSTEYAFLDKETSKPLAHLDKVSKLRGAFQFSPDSRFLILKALVTTDREEKRILFVEVATGKEVASVPGWVGPFFSPNGRQAAAADEDKGISLVDLATGKTTPLAGQEGVSAIAFCFQGSRLASGSKDGTILIWDLTASPKKE